MNFVFQFRGYSNQLVSGIVSTENTALLNIFLAVIGLVFWVED